MLAAAGGEKPQCDSHCLYSTDQQTMITSVQEELPSNLSAVHHEVLKVFFFINTLHVPH